MDNFSKDPIIIIAGATATGKTECAVSIAENIGGEVISADSMQVYKYMDIGTAKPSKEEMRGVRHYLIDELFPDEEFNAAVFKRMAENYIEEIHSKGKIPIIAGGTGFYINAVIKGAEFPTEAVNLGIREFYKNLSAERGNEYVHGILRQKDYVSAEKIHANDIKRVIRALEYIETTGGLFSKHNYDEKSKAVRDGVLLFILDVSRNLLYEKIDKRVDKMLEGGLLGEVKSLIDMGYDESLNSMKAIGYKEMIKHIKGEYTFEEASQKIKQATRNYAKRQDTWFRGQTDGIRIDASYGRDAINEIINNEIRRRKNAD